MFSWQKTLHRQKWIANAPPMPLISLEEARAQVIERTRKPVVVAAPVPVVKFSYHRHCIGKPLRRSDGSLWIGDRRINLGYEWVTVELPFDEAFTLITEGGHALGPALKSDHRDATNFMSHGLALVDIDKGMRLDQLLKHPFYKQYGSGFYTSPSHTEANHRFRIIYRLEKPITDAEAMRQLYEGLLAVHGAADISCKDPARLFYGTTGAARSERTARTLSGEGVAAALALRGQIFAKKQAKTLPVDDATTYDAPTLKDVQIVLDDLRKHYGDFEYKTRFGVTRAVAAHVGSQQACIEMRSRWPDMDKTATYEDLLVDPLKAGGPKLGSLVHMIREKDPGYRKALVMPQQKLIAEVKKEETIDEFITRKRKEKYG